ncbi:hypothetical protein HPB50_027055 [Hyalomma asiaticum]|uniref:Uncharacterized protein n=1 Tax=Hyalomma asiaticum TaxID=266040 RepID=A0ACB7RWV3_HYAAI|nr:hypothetical protein HPB50_027055 [Hyalomma asiaticum]
MKTSPGARKTDGFGNNNNRRNRFVGPRTLATGGLLASCVPRSAERRNIERAVDARKKKMASLGENRPKTREGGGGCRMHFGAVSFRVRENGIGSSAQIGARRRWETTASATPVCYTA